MKHHDIKRINPKPKVKKLSVFDRAVIGLNIDMQNADSIVIGNKYE